jgi:hypothetical protein
MHKLAIFVEGYTELQFVDRLLDEVAGANNVLIEHRTIRGGASARRTMQIIRAASPASGQQYYVLIFDCGSDEQVKTRILEEHDGLTRSNYSKIIGIRDVRPAASLAEVPRLAMGLRTRIKTSLIPVEFILAVMEIEAWFLAETTHFPRIHPAVTVSAIRTALGFDPEHDDLSRRPHPAADLDACYRLGGRRYIKGASNSTIAALDYALIYLQVRTRFPDLDALLTSIDHFLSSPPVG